MFIFLRSLHLPSFAFNMVFTPAHEYYTLKLLSFRQIQLGLLLVLTSLITGGIKIAAQQPTTPYLPTSVFTATELAAQHAQPTLIILNPADTQSQKDFAAWQQLPANKSAISYLNANFQVFTLNKFARENLLTTLIFSAEEPSSTALLFVDAYGKVLYYRVISDYTNCQFNFIKLLEATNFTQANKGPSLFGQTHNENFEIAKLRFEKLKTGELKALAVEEDLLSFIHELYGHGEPYYYYLNLYLRHFYQSFQINKEHDTFWNADYTNTVLRFAHNIENVAFTLLNEHENYFEAAIRKNNLSQSMQQKLILCLYNSIAAAGSERDTYLYKRCKEVMEELNLGSKNKIDFLLESYYLQLSERWDDLSELNNTYFDKHGNNLNHHLRANAAYFTYYYSHTQRSEKLDWAEKWIAESLQINYDAENALLYALIKANRGECEEAHHTLQNLIINSGSKYKLAVSKAHERHKQFYNCYTKY